MVVRKRTAACAEGRDQIELAAAVIQRITLENRRLREQLEDTAKVTAIAPRTTRPPRPPRA
jgi:hypothetical protein